MAVMAGDGLVISQEPGSSFSISLVGAGAQVLGSFSAVFPGTFTGSWNGGGAAGTWIRTPMGSGGCSSGFPCYTTALVLDSGFVSG